MREVVTPPPEFAAAPEKSVRLTQAVVIRTAGCAPLLRRSLAAVGRDMPALPIAIGVVDDSRDPSDVQANIRVISELGMKVHYLSTKETDEGSLLRRIFDRANQLASERGVTAAEVSHGYRYLLTNQEKLDHPTYLPGIEVGNGSKATSNVATIAGAYILGATETPFNNGVITHHDHDVIPGETLLTGPNEIPIFSHFDALQERHEIFRDSETLLSAGKYAGILGTPFGTGEIALKVTKGILSDFQDPAIDPESVSNYKLYDPKTNTFHQMTVTEAYTSLPHIIDSFLRRAPVTGFLTADGKELSSFSSATVQFDAGNFTLKDTVSRRLPAHPTGADEYGILAVVRAFAGDDPEKRIKLEQPVLHIRGDLPDDLDPHGGGLLKGASSWAVRHQVLIEVALAENPNLAKTIYEIVTGDPAPENVVDYLPKLNIQENPNRKKQLENVRSLRKSVQELTHDVRGEDEHIAESIHRLMDEFSESTLAEMEKIRTPSAYDRSEVRRMAAIIKRYYIPALKVWPILYDAAYQVGLEDAVLDK